MVRATVRPVEEDRVLGPELEALTRLFTRQVFEEELIEPGRRGARPASKRMVTSPPL
jgi:hypothetical protein